MWQPDACLREYDQHDDDHDDTQKKPAPFRHLVTAATWSRLADPRP